MMIVIRRDWTNSRIKILEEEGIGIFTIEEIKDIANSRFEWGKKLERKELFKKANNGVVIENSGKMS